MIPQHEYEQANADLFYYPGEDVKTPPDASLSSLSSPQERLVPGSGSSDLATLQLVQSNVNIGLSISTTDSAAETESVSQTNEGTTLQIVSGEN